MFLRSLGKAFRDVGIFVGSAAAVAGAVALQDPVALAPLLVLGPYGPLLVFGVSLAGKTLQDYLKHRGETPSE